MKAASAAQELSGSGKAPTILVVDDNANLARSLARLLALDGYSVRMAGGSPDALAALRESPVDLLVIDVRLRDESGVLLARRWVEQALARTVLFISGDAEAASSGQLENLPAEFLQKPFTHAQLQATLGRLLT